MRGNRAERDGPGFEFNPGCCREDSTLEHAVSDCVLCPPCELPKCPIFFCWVLWRWHPWVSFQALPCLVRKCARHNMYLNVAACVTSENHWSWPTPRFHWARLCYRARAKLFCSILHATSYPTGSVSEVGCHARLMMLTFSDCAYVIISSWFLCLWLQSASIKSILIFWCRAENPFWDAATTCRIV